MRELQRLKASAFTTVEAADPIMKKEEPGAQWQVAVLQELDPNRLAWLLFFSSRSSPIISPSKTDNFERIGPQVERYAQKIGYKDVDVVAGYKLLCNADVQGKKKREPLFLKDKATHVCRYTDTGFALEGFLRAHAEIRAQLIEKLGGKENTVGPWFPFEHPRAPVQMVALTPPGERTPYKMTIRATFTCARCKAHVSHEYNLLWEDERWHSVEATCGGCGQRQTHMRGQPNTRPTAVE